MLILIAIIFISVQIKTLIISSFVLTHDFIPLDSGWGGVCNKYLRSVQSLVQVCQTGLVPGTFTVESGYGMSSYRD